MAKRETSEAGLAAAKRTNPLTVADADTSYPDSFLTVEQFELFREVTWRAFGSVSLKQILNSVIFFCRERLLIFVAADLSAKA